MSSSPKKIVIEALAAGYIPCGLREYAFQVCTRLVARKPDWMHLTFIVPPAMSGCFGEGADYIEAGELKARMMRNLPLVMADLFHALHQICKVKTLPGVPHRLMTVHDINFAHTKTGRSFRHAEGRFLARLGKATHLAFISRFVAGDVAGSYTITQPSRIIYNGVTAPDVTRECRPAAVPEGGYLLHLSSLDEYKNARLLVEMMDYLPDRTLVLAGNCKDNGLAEMAATRKNVIMTGRVSEEEKVWLYNHCDAFLFPSKAEGFGLPPIEVMHLGKPVFLSTLTSLPEVGGDEAFYWPELTPEAMARQVVLRLATPRNPESLKAHARGFSWDNTVEQYLNYYADILNGDN